VAVVYELLPGYTGRPWKLNKLIAIAWNVVLVLVIFAYLHHLYMDFVQLRWMQVLGQMSSYLSAIPAAVMTIFGALANLYRAPVRWTLASSLLVLGVLGWTIGGIAAVIDSTISVNLLFHNTLWVPAHFHTYFLMGVTLMVLGGCFHIAEALSGQPEKRGLSRVTLYLFCIGGYGFLLMFYLSGAASVPRRFAAYPEELAQGAVHARIASGFVLVFLAGLAVYVWETGRRCLRAMRQC
jgi:cytochrome c oxidase subunit 1